MERTGKNTAPVQDETNPTFTEKKDAGNGRMVEHYDNVFSANKKNSKLTTVPASLVLDPKITAAKLANEDEVELGKPEEEFDFDHNANPAEKDEVRTAEHPEVAVPKNIPITLTREALRLHSVNQRNQPLAKK